MLEWLLVFENGETEIIRTYSTKKAHEIAKAKGALEILCIGYR